MSRKYIPPVLVLLAALLLALGTVARAQEPFVGDAIRGGLLYDNWYNTLAVVPPIQDHPLWETRLGDSTRSGASTWRCEACHGWDYKGSSGANGPGTEDYTGFQGVLNVVGDSNEEIMGWLDGQRNPQHDFSTVMDDQALQDLVAFLRIKQIDIALLVDYQTRTALGNPEGGRGLYLRTCAECHGEDGGELNFLIASRPSFIADVAVRDPWRMVHKTRFGHPGTTMPASEGLGWSLQNVADLLAFAQTLPLGTPLSPQAEATLSLEILSTEGQGDPRLILFGALLIAAVILLPAGIDILRARNRPTTKPDSN